MVPLAALALLLSSAIGSLALPAIESPTTPSSNAYTVRSSEPATVGNGTILYYSRAVDPAEDGAEDHTEDHAENPSGDSPMIQTRHNFAVKCWINDGGPDHDTCKAVVDELRVNASVGIEQWIQRICYEHVVDSQKQSCCITWQNHLILGLTKGERAPFAAEIVDVCAINGVTGKMYPGKKFVQNFHHLSSDHQWQGMRYVESFAALV